MLLTLGGTACAGGTAARAWLAADAPVELTVEADRVTVTPRGDVRLNGQLPPALEYADGAVARLALGARVDDDAYFAAAASGPPAATTARPVRLRISFCRSGEALCRSQVFPLNGRAPA